MNAELMTGSGKCPEATHVVIQNEEPCTIELPSTTVFLGNWGKAEVRVKPPPGEHFFAGLGSVLPVRTTRTYARVEKGDVGQWFVST